MGGCPDSHGPGEDVDLGVRFEEGWVKREGIVIVADDTVPVRGEVWEEGVFVHSPSGENQEQGGLGGSG